VEMAPVARYTFRTSSGCSGVDFSFQSIYGDRFADENL
jgi:hypothetical protein